MSKPKDLYIYVGHEPIELTWKHGQVIKVPGNDKRDCRVIRKAVKKAIMGYYQNEGILKGCLEYNLYNHRCLVTL